MTDPVDLAREVLGRDDQDIVAVLAARPGIESQTLARAVIATAATLDDLGDLLDDASTWGPDDEERMLPKLHAIRARIRAAITRALHDH